MLHSVLGCCEIDKYSLRLSRKAILDFLCQQENPIYRRPPVSIARLGRSGSMRVGPHLGSEEGAIKGLQLVVLRWHTILVTATCDAVPNV